MFQNKKRIYTFIKSCSIVVPYYTPGTRYTVFTMAVGPPVCLYVDENLSGEMSHSFIATVFSFPHCYQYYIFVIYFVVI